MSDKPEKIEWRKLQASNGDSYYGYFKGLQISYIMDFGKKDEYILSFEDVEEEEKTYHSTVDEAKSRAEELLDNWLIRADLSKPTPRLSEMYDRIQGYIRVIQEKDALLADLAKPSECNGQCPECQKDLEAKIDELEKQVKIAYEAGQLMCECAKPSEWISAINKIHAKVRKLEWKSKGHHCDAGKACQAIADIIKTLPPPPDKETK